MISKEERYRRLIQLFEYENPAFRIKKELGRGQHGVAFELEDGNVIKFTIDGKTGADWDSAPEQTGTLLMRQS